MQHRWYTAVFMKSEHSPGDSLRSRSNHVDGSSCALEAETQKRQAVKLLVSAMIWVGRGLKPGLLCTSFRKLCSWAHNCCSASRPRRPANRKVQDEIGPRRNVPVPRLWDAKSPNEWLEASFDSQRTTSTTAYGGSTTTASRYNCYLNFIHFSQAINPHRLGSGRLKGFFI